MNQKQNYDLAFTSWNYGVDMIYKDLSLERSRFYFGKREHKLTLPR